MNKKSNYLSNSIFLMLIFYSFYKLILWRCNVNGMINHANASIASKIMAVS